MSLMSCPKGTLALPGHLPPAVAARTQAEVTEVLGERKRISRQVLYRRSIEQWHYDTPLSLCVVLEAAKGQIPRVQNVLVPGVTKP